MRIEVLGSELHKKNFDEKFIVLVIQKLFFLGQVILGDVNKVLNF